MVILDCSTLIDQTEKHVVSLRWVALSSDKRADLTCLPTAGCWTVIGENRWGEVAGVTVLLPAPVSLGSSVGCNLAFGFNVCLWLLVNYRMTKPVVNS